MAILNEIKGSQGSATLARRHLYAIIIFISATYVTNTEAIAGRLYLCKVKEYYATNDSGHLIKQEDNTLINKEKIIKSNLNISFDSDSGHMRIGPYIFKDGPYNSLKMKKLREDNNKNDLVAVDDYDGPGAYIHSVLRIRIWLPEMPFSYTHELKIMTGTCKAQ
ncbi:hypothetical protein [Govanella unica]|uniref:Uncharacterized protein n=1 Tax=Govanella unica TaxID=2975056 RepID=A0A9X3Z790_9PROT|nr:hypothetical protein [Govania unica]MDA5193995.1 hypothetical protein [Govania unica]